MDTNAIASIIENLAWPVTLIVFFVLYKRQIGDLILNSKELSGPGGFRYVRREMQEIKETIKQVEASTRNLSVDIYKVTGDALQVRENIWKYIADILNTKVSPETRFEMQRELTKYHLPNLGMSISDVKKRLSRLGYELPMDGEQGGFSNEITPEFCQAVKLFQSESTMLNADGIVGPKTVGQLRQQVQTLKSSQPVHAG